jgi:cellobiose phosphorylase
MAYESPTYRIEERIGKIELRRYEPYVVAETLVDESLERAGNGGFRRLAGTSSVATRRPVATARRSR